MMLAGAAPVTRHRPTTRRGAVVGSVFLGAASGLRAQLGVATVVARADPSLPPDIPAAVDDGLRGWERVKSACGAQEGGGPGPCGWDVQAGAARVARDTTRPPTTPRSHGLLKNPG